MKRIVKLRHVGTPLSSEVSFSAFPCSPFCCVPRLSLRDFEFRSNAIENLELPWFQIEVLRGFKVRLIILFFHLYLGGSEMVSMK